MNGSNIYRTPQNCWLKKEITLRAVYKKNHTAAMCSPPAFHWSETQRRQLNISGQCSTLVQCLSLSRETARCIELKGNNVLKWGNFQTYIKKTCLLEGFGTQRTCPWQPPFLTPPTRISLSSCYEVSYNVTVLLQRDCSPTT